MRWALKTGIGLDSAKQREHLIFNSMQGFFGMTLKTQDQHRGGVGGSN